MADDLSTPELVDAVLAATCSYDVDNSLANCKRFIAAVRRKMQFPHQASRGGGASGIASVGYDLQVLQQQLREALVWRIQNDSTEDSNNPAVSHFDASGMTV